MENLIKILVRFLPELVEWTGYESRQTSEDYVIVRFYDLSRDTESAQT